MSVQINSGSLHGSGSLLTQELTAGKTYSFSVSNEANNTYPNNAFQPMSTCGTLTLSGASFTNKNLDANYTISGSLDNFVGVMEAASGSTKIVQNERGWSVTLPKGSYRIPTGSFDLTPAVTIPANSIYIKATGLFNIRITP